jgi:predicted HAD superfamily phosphohydrolase
MSQSEEAWNDVGEQFRKLGSMFKHHYEAQEHDEGTEVVSEGEVRDAVRTLGESIRTAYVTVGDAIKDPEVQEEARQTAGSLFDALGATFSELGDDISKWRERGESLDPPSPTEAAPPDASEEEE